MEKSENKSHAVRNRRRAGTIKSLDMFPTPPWGTRALLQWLVHTAGFAALGESTVWEPCCGKGHMVYALEPHFKKVIATDVHDYGFGYKTFDATKPLPVEGSVVDFVITNPPFNAAEEIFTAMYDRARLGVCMLLRFNWAETTGRHARVFGPNPPTHVIVFSERLPMQKEVYNPDGSTATCYAWFVWLKNTNYSGRTQMEWFPPGTRDESTREEDAEVTGGWDAD